MKTGFLLLALVLAAVSRHQGTGDRGQRPEVSKQQDPGGLPPAVQALRELEGSSKTPELPWNSPDTAPKTIFVVPALAGQKSYSPATPTSSTPRLWTWTNAPGLTTPKLAEPPMPGVYKTVPYTCVVIVPGTHPDDRMPSASGAQVEPNMPVVRPDLQFIPLK